VIVVFAQPESDLLDDNPYLDLPECGYEEEPLSECPKCGSTPLTYDAADPSVGIFGNVLYCEDCDWSVQS
jgi:hypothetical protein